MRSTRLLLLQRVALSCLITAAVAFGCDDASQSPLPDTRRDDDVRSDADEDIGADDTRTGTDTRGDDARDTNGGDAIDSTDTRGGDGDIQIDTGTDVVEDMTDAVGDMGSDADMTPPMPDDVAPCTGTSASCWEPTFDAARCGTASIDENYSSGNYNVHRWSARLDADADVTITFERTGGSWQPAIIVTDLGGNVLFDGDTGLTDPTGSLVVTPGPDGRTGSTALVQIRSDVAMGIYVFVTGWHVADSGFADPMPTDATYTLTVQSVCDDPYYTCTVNGYTVDEPACGWLHHIARQVVPRLEGTRDERLTNASRVAWWALKEGVLFLDNPIVYSNCNFSSGDARIGPLETCPDMRAWQVGLSGVQVPGRDLVDLEATASTLFPNLTSDEVLANTAAEALLDETTAQAVVDSTGDLRRSWLLRTSAIGFTFQEPTVTRECIDDSLGWCYGTGWSATQKFAPDRAGAMQSIDDIRAFFDMVAP